MTAPAHQRTVVLVHTRALLDVVVDAVGTIRASGARVVLVGPELPDTPRPRTIADEVVVLRRHDTREALQALRGSPLSMARGVFSAGLDRLVGRSLGAATLWWRATRRTPTALAAIDVADTITAVDAGAVYVVWQAARRAPAAAAVNGIGPTLEHLGLA